MIFRNRTMIMSFTFFAFSASLVNAASAHHPVMCEDTIHSDIRKINSESDRGKRIDLSTELAFYVRDHPDCKNGSKIVDDLVTLLSDKVDGVRMGAAMALGYIGPPAMRAVPALEKAVKESDAIMDADPDTVLPVNSSGEEAREALRKITGKKVPAYQESGK